MIDRASKTREEIFGAIRSFTAATIAEAEQATDAIIRIVNNAAPSPSPAPEAVHLTEYEIQVLLGTSISGCNMSPDRVFSLDMAWHRLYALGLIDRTDGLAIITKKGSDVVATILASLSQPAKGAEGGE